MRLERAIDRSLRNEVFFCVNEPNCQFAGRQFRFVKGQIDDLGSHCLGDAVPYPARAYGRSACPSGPCSTKRSYQRWDVVGGMPILASVRRTGRCDGATRRMIAGFSTAGYHMHRRPRSATLSDQWRSWPQRSCFFLETLIFQGNIGHQLRQGYNLRAQFFHLAGIGQTHGIPRQRLLANFEKFLRTPLLQVLRDPFLAAQFCNAVFATKISQHDPYLLLRRVELARRAADVLHSPLGRGLVVMGFFIIVDSM